MSDNSQGQDPNLGDPNGSNNPAAAVDGSSDTGSGQTQQSNLDTGRTASGASPDPADSNEGQDGGQADGQQGQSQQTVESARPRADWRDARIAKLTAQLHETRGELARTRANGTGTTVPSPGPAPTPDIEALANARAQEIAATAEFNRACNETAAAGRQAFPDFDSKINGLRGLVNPQDASEAAAYNSFLSAAIETGEAHRLLYHLGGDLNEAQRILALPPVKMAVELTKLATRAPEALSGAPRPIRPVTGGRQAAHTAVDPRDPERADNLSTAEWMRRREQQLAEQAGGTRH